MIRRSAPSIRASICPQPPTRSCTAWTAPGTTFNWANYLSKVRVSPEWKQKVGEGTSVEWPTGAGGKGNEGVAAFVALAKNSIGYVEYAYAIKNKLAYGLVQNRAGRFVQPGAETFQAAAENANWTGARFLPRHDRCSGEKRLSITATVFIVMYKQPKDFGRAKRARDFFRWSLENGQPQAAAARLCSASAFSRQTDRKLLELEFGG